MKAVPLSSYSTPYLSANGQVSIQAQKWAALSPWWPLIFSRAD